MYEHHPVAGRSAQPVRRAGAGGRHGSGSYLHDDPGSNPASSDIVLTNERRSWSEKQEKHRR